MVNIYRFSMLLLAVSFQSQVYAQVPKGSSAALLDSGNTVSTEKDNSAASRLKKLEIQFFGRSYDQEDLYKRLSRLENSVFGGASFDSVHDRLDRIELVLGKGQSPKIENSRRVAQYRPATTQVKQSSDQKFADLLNRAQANISLKKYQVAADELMSAVQINPTSSLAFRQLGDVLVELRDIEGAQEAYKACFEEDQFGENGKYAKSKLLALFPRVPSRRRSAPSTPVKPQNVLGTIDSQINEYTNKVNKEGQQGAVWRAKASGREIDKIQQDTEQWLQDAQTYSTSGGMPFGSRRGGTRGSGVWTGRGASSVSSSGSSRVKNDINDVGRTRTNFVNADGQIQSENALNEASERSRHFTESAKNLKDQLSQKGKKGDVNLKPVGTNVYIRYYGNDSSNSKESK